MPTLFTPMKYRTATCYDDKDYTIILVEDGGVANIINMGSYIHLELYQEKIDSDTQEDNIWEDLSIGNIYSQDFTTSTEPKLIIEAALAWLCVFHRPEDFILDLENQIFPTIFPND